MFKVFKNANFLLLEGQNTFESTSLKHSLRISSKIPCDLSSSTNFVTNAGSVESGWSGTCMLASMTTCTSILLSTKCFGVNSICEILFVVDVENFFVLGCYKLFLSRILMRNAKMPIIQVTLKNT